MKIFKTLFVILIGLYSSVANAQTEEPKAKHHTIATFEIKDARYNGDNITNQALKDNATLIFYTSSEIKSILFSNYWGKSQSYGDIYSITKSENPDKEEENKSEIYSFYWSYKNSYDAREGTAKVKILVVYKPQGTYFEITILPENLDEIVYKGRMEGDLAILEWDSKR